MLLAVWWCVWWCVRAALSTPSSISSSSSFCLLPRVCVVAWRRHQQSDAEGLKTLSTLKCSFYELARERAPAKSKGGWKSPLSERLLQAADVEATRRQVAVRACMRVGVWLRE